MVVPLHLMHMNLRIGTPPRPRHTAGTHARQFEGIVDTRNIGIINNDIGATEKLQFLDQLLTLAFETGSMSSTDIGAYGMNTPAYCCFDNFVTLVGEATGSKSIAASASKASVEGILSPDGTRINALQKGMNILLLDDGTTRKIFK